jgi:NADPH:quinone reductase-like Zn-dependent oxidoreductase
MPATVRFHSLGGPEVLRLDEVDVPLPAEGEVCIRTRALGLNRAEARFRTGNDFVEPEFPQELVHLDFANGNFQPVTSFVKA